MCMQACICDYMRATFPVDDVWYTVVGDPVSCSLHLISLALRHQEKLTSYFKDGRKWCLVHPGLVHAMQRRICFMSTLEFGMWLWCRMLGLKETTAVLFRWSSIPSPIVGMDLEDFLDLTTYTCPITGRKRCAVSAALQTTTDTKPKRLRVAWYHLASFPHSF